MGSRIRTREMQTVEIQMTYFTTEKIPMTSLDHGLVGSMTDITKVCSNLHRMHPFSFTGQQQELGSITLTGYPNQPTSFPDLKCKKMDVIN